MDLLTIENLLPNGFHDAYLIQLTWDFMKREARVLLDVLVGNDDQPASERYRRCLLNIRGCAVVMIEPAIAYREIKSPRGLQIDRTDLNEKDRKAVMEGGYEIPEGNFWLTWFVYEWNSRIIINARDASLEFTGGG
jgi:hypothetical protein